MNKKLLDETIKKMVQKELLKEDTFPPQSIHRAKSVYNNLINFAKTALQEISRNTYDSEFHRNTVEDIERNVQIINKLEINPQK